MDFLDFILMFLRKKVNNWIPFLILYRRCLQSLESRHGRKAGTWNLVAGGRNHLQKGPDGVRHRGEAGAATHQPTQKTQQVTYGANSKRIE